MADIVLRAQQQFAQKFYRPAKDFNDDFAPEVASTSQPGARRFRQVSPIGSSVAGDVNTFRISSAGGLISDMWLEISLGATGGGTYASFPAINFISRVRVAHGGNELHNYNYQQVYESVNTLWPNEIKSQFQAAAGGATPSAATVCEAPIFTFWTGWKHEKNEFRPPLPLCVSKDDLTIEITTRSIAAILAAGGSGGSLVSLTLKYFEYNVDTAELAKLKQMMLSDAWNYFGYDWGDVAATGSTVATATATTLDLSGLSGDIKELVLQTKLVSDVDTAHNYYINKDLTAMSLKVDGVELDKFDSSNERKIRRLTSDQAKVGADATLGVSEVVPFGRRRDAHNYDGSLPSQAYNKLELTVTHALGANAYVYVCATFSRYYIYRNGLFERVK